MKTLNKVLSEIYGDRKIEGGEKSFVDKHVIKQFGVIDGKDYAGNPVDGAPYKATNKYYKRSPRHGFDTGADAKVYEETDLDEGFVKRAMLSRAIKNKAKDADAYSKMHDMASNKHYEIANRSTDPKARAANFHQGAVDSVKADKLDRKSKTMNKGAKRVARVVGLMNQLEVANGGPLNEKLMQNIAGKLRARSLRKSLETRSSAYHDMARNADDSAERHAKRANEAPDSGERKFFKNTESGVRDKARRFRNKANHIADRANRVTPRHAGIVKAMREETVEEGARLQRFQRARDNSRKPWKTLHDKVITHAMLGSSIGGVTGYSTSLATGKSATLGVAGQLAGAAAGIATGIAHHAVSRTIDTAKEYKRLSKYDAANPKPAKAKAPGKTLKQVVAGKLIKHASDRSTPYKWALKNK